jgi:hypothetical protein
MACVHPVTCSRHLLCTATCRYREGDPIAKELLRREPDEVPSSCPFTRENMHYFPTRHNPNRRKRTGESSSSTDTLLYLTEIDRFPKPTISKDG